MNNLLKKITLGLCTFCLPMTIQAMEKGSSGSIQFPIISHQEDALWQIRIISEFDIQPEELKNLIQQENNSPSHKDMYERLSLRHILHETLEKNENQLMNSGLTRYYAQGLFPLNPSPLGVYNTFKKLAYEKVDAGGSVYRQLPKGMTHWNTIANLFKQRNLDIDQYTPETVILICLDLKLPVMIKQNQKELAPLDLSILDRSKYELYKEFKDSINTYSKRYEEIVHRQIYHNDDLKIEHDLNSSRILDDAHFARKLQEEEDNYYKQTQEKLDQDALLAKRLHEEEVRKHKEWQEKRVQIPTPKTQIDEDYELALALSRHFENGF